MKKKTRKPKSKDVTVAVTQKDYDREVRAGVKEDETFKPGVYRGRRGGFLERRAASSSVQENLPVLVGPKRTSLSLSCVDNVYT
jgi:hypothetical protein